MGSNQAKNSNSAIIVWIKLIWKGKPNQLF
jgi:hypothetical protein